jgi:hypothetical protein
MIEPTLPLYLQQPCTICGALTDLPAVWTCACGAYRLCYRSRCHMKIPAEHRRGECAADAPSPAR